VQLYKWQAQTAHGEAVDGVMQATASKDVRAALAARNLRVSSITSKGGLKGFLTLEKKVKPQEVIIFCRQLATFVSVGVPVTTGLTTIAEQTADKQLRKACNEMVAEIQRGARLSDTVRAHPLVFPTIVGDMVHAAEASGDLEGVLRQAAHAIDREASARQKIRAAMIYPAIICSLAVVLTIAIIAFVLPQFKDLYASLGVKLPGVVSVLLGMSDFVRSHAIVLLASLLLLIVGLVYWQRSEAGRVARDRLFIKLPVIAPMVRAAVVERFCRTLADLLAAGVPIGQTFSVVIETTSNRVYRRAIRSVMAAMGTGEGICRPLQATGLFPPIVTQMVRVGEETGSLDRHLSETALMAGEDLDYRIKKMTSIIEPVLIIFVGLMVGFVAVTMVTTIYSLAGGYK
jgi:type IV pilus assembly protein PilC